MCLFAKSIMTSQCLMETRIIIDGFKPRASNSSPWGLQSSGFFVLKPSPKASGKPGERVDYLVGHKTRLEYRSDIPDLSYDVHKPLKASGIFVESVRFNFSYSPQCGTTKDLVSVFFCSLFFSLNHTYLIL